MITRRIFALTAMIGLSSIGGCTAQGQSDVSNRVGEVFRDPGSRNLASAAARGDTREIERLVQAGTPIDAKGDGGATPLWWAMRNRNYGGVAYLLAHGANPDPDVEYITVPEMAATYEDSRFLETLLRYKFDVNRIGSKRERRPIDVAVDTNGNRNLELLIKAGANLGLGQKIGSPPLISAAHLNYYEKVYILLLGGADPTLKFGASTLSGAIAFPIDPDSDAYVWRERVIRYLKSKGIEASKPSGEGKRTKPLPPDLGQ